MPHLLSGYIFVTRELDTEIIEAGLEISYNLCNLPKQITAEDGTLVNYTYFADGTKFKAVDAVGNGFVYTGSLRWSVQNGTLTPESIAITGGRAVFADNSWATNYYITDHLGSVRAVTDAEGEVLDTFDYMPYGSEISSTSSTTTDYRFTGKERQSMVNNSIYDSFARFQNTYGRFMSIDPKAESFYHISPYAYCAGDPVNLVDPDGEAHETWWDILCLIDGGRSLVTNLREGNYRDAFFDAIGVVYDAAAVFVPFMPGGANVALKTWRTAKNAKVLDKIWDMKSLDRGMVIEKMLGGWCDNFPVIDKYDEITKTATSIKSIDLNAKSYASPSAITRKLNEYTDALYNFKGDKNKNHDAQKILQKKLEIAIPSNSSEAALQAVYDAIKYANDKGIEVIIHKM
ncbi:MAG: hypothetical protein J6S09_07110 [Paludibacteraceae bacterium]|nr:hypothetical protein [Paludibacteraceae bacterium]